MNHTYRLVWNQETQRYVPAPECAKGKGKSSAKSKTKALAPAAVILSTVLALPAWAQTSAPAPAANQLPTGGQIVSGSAHINQSGSQMQIQQGSQKAIIDWTSFNIGKNASVTFQQNNASAIALNRVTAGDASHIHGQLNANGQVWLINPNGIVFGQGSQVDVGGLVASTMNITNADFNNGNYTFTRNGATGSITNQGELTAQDGGSIALLAPTVSNDGILRAQLGTVALAAGDKITLQAGANGLLHVEIDPATIRTLVENKQLIVADGGQVIMTGRAADQLSSSVVANTGTIQANRLQEKDGKILLIADMQHGETQAAGKLEAHFIDTSAAKVSIDQDLHINTAGGQWLIDPVDITIDAGKAGAIVNALDSGNVTIATSDGAENPWGSNGSSFAAGDIYVVSPINNTSTSHTLTLRADRDIHIFQPITLPQGGLTLHTVGTTPAGGIILPEAAVQVGRFTLEKGMWMQEQANPFAFSATDFRLGKGAVFVRSASSAGAPYRIFDVYGLQGIGTLLDVGNVSSYLLTQNIDASGTAQWNGGAGFVPIGDSSTAFSGHFDGQGHTISGLKIHFNPSSGAARGGLFGELGTGSQVRNLGLANVDVASDINTTAPVVVGALAGINRGSISNSWSSGTVSAKSGGENMTGGLVGGNYGTINASHSDAIVSSSLFGFGSSNHAGGLVGWSSSGSITNSHATGSVTTNYGYYSNVGGLVGALYADASISDSFATGNVSALNLFDNLELGGNAGGLVGWSAGSIYSSYAAGDVYAWGHAYQGPYSYTNIHVGGLVGHNRGNIQYSYATGNPVLSTSGGYTYNRVGGLIGYNTGSIGQVYASGRARQQNSNNIAGGGLIGENAGGTITNAYYATTDADGNSINNGGNTGYAFGMPWSGNAYGSAKTRTELMNSGLYTGWDSSIWNLPKGEAGEGYEIGLPALTGVTRPQDVVRSTWFDGGWGTADSAYGIVNWGQLSNMRLLLDKHYRLNDDLGGSTDGYAQHASATANGGAGFKPIGADTSTPFTGTLDGQGHTISDLVVKASGTGLVYAGLFGVVSGGAKISNLGLINATVSASGGSHSRAGALAGLATGKTEISHSYASGGSVAATGASVANYVGGLIGFLNGPILTDSYASSEVSSLVSGFDVNSYAGGLFGYSTSSHVKRSYASGMVSISGGGQRNYAGGLGGYIDFGTIASSYASGNVSAADGLWNYAGGLVGGNWGGISQSYATGIVSAIGNVQTAGGLVGASSSGAKSNHSFYATTDAGGNAINNGGVAAGEWSSNALGTPKTWDELKQASTFTAWGSDLATHAGSSAIWRIYDGNTLPLLRSWLKPKTVTVSVQDLPTDIEYNGAAISGSLTASGHDGGSAVQGDLNTSLSYSTTSKNAGTYSTQDGSLQLLGSGLYSDQQGYDIAYGLDTVLVIQPKALTVSGTTVADKTYDGNTGAEVSLGTVSGWVNDERLNISAIGTFDNKNAGTAKQVEVAYTLNDGSNGGLASNYRLTDGNSYTAAIEPKALTITATNASKTQGETLQLNGSTGFVVGSGLVDGESIVQVELASPGTGAEADAGAHDIIASAASGSNGFDADNYTITYQKGTLTVIASSGSGTGGNPGGGSNPGDNGGSDNPGDNGSGSNPGDNGGGSNPGDNGGGSNSGDNGSGGNPGDNGGGSNPGDNGGGSNPGDNGSGGNPGDNGGGGNPGDNGGGSNPGDNGGGSNPGDNGGGSNPGDNGSGGNPGDNGGGSNPGDNGSGGNPGDNGGGSNPGDNGGGSNPGDNGGGSNPGDNGGGSNPGDNGGGSNPGDNGGGSNPGDNGGGSNPGDNGGGSNPGDNGSGSNPSDNGSGSNPGDNGGGDNPGDNGGGGNPGDNGGGDNPGDNGGGGNPGDNGGSDNPGDNGSGDNPGDTGGTSEGESARQPNVPIPSGGALWLAQQTTEDERLARNRMAALELQREDRVPYLTLTPEFIRVPGPEGGEGENRQEKRCATEWFAALIARIRVTSLTPGTGFAVRAAWFPT